jgi:Protein of unknown function (DUF1822)
MNNQHPVTSTCETISIPLGFKAHDWASEQCQNITDLATRQQKYATSLAIYALHRYFAYLSIDSTPESRLLDSAGLELAEIGQLVCAVVDRQATTATIPHRQIERIGCVVLRMDGELTDIENINELEIVGFTPKVASEISLTDLASTEELLLHLQSLTARSVATSPNPIMQRIRELVPQVSIVELTQKVKELATFGDDAPFKLNDWLKSFLVEAQPPIALEGHAREKATKELDLAKKELRKLSYKLMQSEL